MSESEKKCQNPLEPENVRMFHNRKVSESFKTGKRQNLKMSECFTTEKCQNPLKPEKNVRIRKCQNFLKPENVRI